tara:strand:- start:447 stop:1256 length:810 start_codon:yes stop_codon:yes gene_type:complete
MDRLKGRTALITGAARGLGAQIAKRFAENGAFVFVNDLSQDSAAQVAKTIGGRAIACDVSDSKAVEQMFAEIETSSKKLDILVNNAGISGMEGNDNAKERYLESMGETDEASRPAILDVTDSQWQKMLDVHLNGTFFCSREAVRLMTHQGLENSPASIINMGSIMGTFGRDGGAAYCSAKGGILALTRSLAHELAPLNIRVNALAPGFIDTDMVKPFEAIHPKLKAQTPLGRIGETDDIAWAALYLASDEAKFVTGQTISPNGGFYMSQ